MRSKRLTDRPELLKILHDGLRILLKLGSKLRQELELSKKTVRSSGRLGLLEEKRIRDGSSDGISVSFPLGELLNELGDGDFESD